MSKKANQKNKEKFSWLVGDKEIIDIIQSKNWEKTKVGSIKQWPQNLRNILNLCLEAQYPIAIYWGSEFILFYNKSWRPIVGNKHPQSFGQQGVEVWPEVWNVIGPMFNSVIETGQAIWLTDQQFFLERFGYIEECFFNLSLNPIRTSQGKIEGIFNVVIETTYRVLNDRRTKFLQHLSSQTATAKTSQEACLLSAKVIAENPTDIPFCLLYLINNEEQKLNLTASCGIYTEQSIVPKEILLSETKQKDDLWKINEVLHAKNSNQIKDFSLWSEILTENPWPEKPKVAFIVPIFSGSHNTVTGILILGVSARLAFDSDYQNFLTRFATP